MTTTISCVSYSSETTTAGHTVRYYTRQRVFLKTGLGPASSMAFMNIKTQIGPDKAIYKDVT
jgi:hypothetical protein